MERATRIAIAVTMLLAAGMAGCTDQQDASPGSGELDTIVPGTWHVSSAIDRSFVWVHNPRDTEMQASWNLTLQDGQPLPTGWNVTFSPSSATLAADGTRPGGGQYPDWAWSLATLRVPADAQGTYEAELRFGNMVRQINIELTQPFAPVSGPGDTVEVTYDGRFSGGEQFDEGSFETTLGSGQTVTGFDYGLTGLAEGEEVTLVIPPAFAYGYDNPPGRYERFNGQTLHFTVSLDLPAPPRDPYDPRCVDQSDVPDPRAPFSGSNDDVRVRFNTTLGDFVVETDTEHTPQTVENFLQYVDEGFYACTTFHRIAPGFVVQGGGYLADHATLKETRDPIPLEATTQKPNLQWTLSMARTNAPDSATSQFFVNLEDNPSLDPTGPDTGYAVFARVVEGFDTIEAMTEVERGRSFGAGGFWPEEPIVILHAARV